MMCSAVFKWDGRTLPFQLPQRMKQPTAKLVRLWRVLLTVENGAMKSGKGS